MLTHFESVDIYSRRLYSGINQLMAIKLAHEDFNLPGMQKKTRTEEEEIKHENAIVSELLEKDRFIESNIAGALTHLDA